MSVNLLHYKTREMIISSKDIIFFLGEKFSQERLMVQTSFQAMYRKFCHGNLKQWVLFEKQRNSKDTVEYII